MSKWHLVYKNIVMFCVYSALLYVFNLIKKTNVVFEIYILAAPKRRCFTRKRCPENNYRLYSLMVSVLQLVLNLIKLGCFALLMTIRNNVDILLYGLIAISEGGQNVNCYSLTICPLHSLFFQLTPVCLLMSGPSNSGELCHFLYN